MMNKNMNSPTKLTEFAPLSPEESQPVVASLFSKLFGLGKGTSPSNENSVASPNNDEQSSSGESDSWKCIEENATDKSQEEEDNRSGTSRFPLDATEGRSLPNVLKRISNIVALKSSNLKSYKDSQLRSFWMPDDVSKQCYECGERFTTFRRKHHCRVCGQIFCSKCCSDKIPGKIMGCTGDLRVCTYCCKVVLSYLQSSDMRSVLSADLKALQEDLQVKYGRVDSRAVPQQESSSDRMEDETRVCRKASVGYMEEKYALGRSTSSYLGGQERSRVLQNSAPLRIIYEELFRSSKAIPLQTHRVRLKSFHNCFTGSELVNWIISHNKATTRVQAVAIGQALLEAGFIESAQSENPFGDGPSLFRPIELSRMQSYESLDQERATCDSQEPAWVTTIPQHDSTTDSESETKQGDFQPAGRLPSSSSSFYLDLNLEASTVTLKRPTSEDLCAGNAIDDGAATACSGNNSSSSSSTTGSCNNNDDGAIKQKEINIKSHRCESGVTDELLSPDTLHVQEFKEPNSWHKANNLRSAFGEMSAYNALTCAYRQHEASLIGQLLNKEGLSEGWTDTILSLAHDIIDHIRPDLHHDADDMDVRHYVQIKKSPGGKRHDCEIVSGVVCSKNVAHRGMNAMIANPKILLLKCGLMYQRVEGKLLSLEPVMMQENEYLGHTVARITALGPDVVLVHRPVSRLAQDRFRQCGVTLVLNVKLSVLERVARCTGGAIVSTIDHLTTRYKLGNCQKFYLRNFPNDKNGYKTLMYFEGCPKPHLGATILLRGGSQSELKRVKKVTSMMIFASYSWRLEKSFLMDEFAKPPSQHDGAFLEDESPVESPRDDPPFEASGQAARRKKKKSIPEANPIDSPSIFGDDSRNSADEPRPRISEDSPLSAETLKRVSTILADDADPYDTLRLFKPSSRAALDEGKKSSDPEKPPESSEVVPGLGEKIPFKEKRLHGRSASDPSDPYDTLKLFKSSNRTAPDPAGLERKKSSDPEKPESSEIAPRLREKIPSEEKRVHGQSVSDRSDPLHQYLNEDDDGQLKTNEGSKGSNENFPKSDPTRQTRLSVADLPLLNKFKKALDDTILSLSPYLKFSIPYLETEPGRNCALRRFFPKEIFYSVHLLDAVSGGRVASSLEHPEDCASTWRLRPEHPFVLAKFTSGLESRTVQSLLANFRACGSRLLVDSVVASPRVEPEARPEVPDCLEPENHQRLSVLFCSFSGNRSNAPTFCVNPWVVKMDLYGRNDIALGRFLERYCLNPDYKCLQACRTDIGQHERRFAHEGGCIHISLAEMSTEPFGHENTGQILMWTKCLRCKSVSPVVPMSSDTWSLSFAKYLELRFHGRVYTKRGSEDCKHSIHQEHSQYFARNNMLAVFKYTEISQWEISLPPPLINIDYDAKQHANIIEEIKSLALKGDEVFSSIREKLSGIQVDPEVLSAAKQQLVKDQQCFKNKIEEIQLKLTSPTLENRRLEGKSSERQVQTLMFRIEDGIVISKRLISEAVSYWNDRFQEIGAKKRDDRPRRFTERSVTIGSGVTDTDGYITEDAESQIEDLSPVSADYNAIDAISAVHNEAQGGETVESSDEIGVDNGNPEDIVVVQESPKFHQRSHSDVLPITSDDLVDRRKKSARKKTILSQLLPSTAIINPIANPLASFQHHLLPLGSVVPMVVYESEPSSIIAYALDSNDYKHALAEILPVSRVTEQNSSPLNKRKFAESKENTGGDLTQSGEFKRPSVLSFLRGNSPSPASPMETDKTFVAAETSAPNQSGSGAAAESEEDKRTVKQQTYIEVQFNDATTNFYCRIYFAAQFAALRESVLPCGEDGFTRSLCRSVQWAARGGKSGSAFCKSRDDRFILKELSRLEMQIFLDFAPNYFAYMEKCQQTKQPTLLGKIVGVYRVSFKNNTTNAALRTSVLVMENLFYGRAITDKFDLKGSVRNRLVNPEDVDSEGELVLLDENLLNMSCDSPLYIRSHSKAVLNKAIERDTKFLADNSVMDYSLLVGLEPTSDELVLGIIDYIRTFTWDKKLETIVKKSGILGGQGKLPTIVSPEEYRARFIAAMHRYFLPVPDRWTDLGRGVIE